MENDIIQMIKDINEGNEIFDLDTDLFEKGLLDSLGIANIIVRLEDKYRIEISPEDIIPENFVTVNSMVLLLKKYK